MNANVLISSALNRPAKDIPANGRFSQVEGWDSLAHMRIILSIEEQLDRELTSIEILEIMTIESVEKILSNG